MNVDRCIPRLFTSFSNYMYYERWSRSASSYTPSFPHWESFYIEDTDNEHNGGMNISRSNLLLALPLHNFPTWAMKSACVDDSQEEKWGLGARTKINWCPGVPRLWPGRDGYRGNDGPTRGAIYARRGIYKSSSISLFVFSPLVPFSAVYQRMYPPYFWNLY